MADVTLSVPNGTITTRTLDAYAAVFNRPVTVLVNDVEVPNPETKAAFFKRQLIIQVKNLVLNYEADQAAIAVKAAADTLTIT